MHRYGLSLSRQAPRLLLKPLVNPFVLSVRYASTSTGRQSKTPTDQPQKSTKINEPTKPSTTKSTKTSPPKETTKEIISTTKGTKETTKDEPIVIHNKPTKETTAPKSSVPQEKDTKSNKRDLQNKSTKGIKSKQGQEEIDLPPAEAEILESLTNTPISEVHKEKQTQKKITLKESADTVKVISTTTTTETTTTVLHQKNNNDNNNNLAEQPQEEPTPEQKPPVQLSPAKQALELARQALESKPVDYKRAIQYYARALKIFHSERNIQMICEMLLAIAKAHACNHTYVESFSTLKEMAHFSKQMGRPDMESLSMTVMGTIISQFEKGEEQAKSFLELGLKLASQPPTQYCKQESMNIAKKAALEALGNYEKLISNEPEKAEEYFKAGLKLAEEDNDLDAKLRFQKELLLEEEEEGEDDVVHEDDPDMEATNEDDES